MADLDTSLGGSHGAFPKTTGGLIARFGDPTSPDRRADVEQLCRRYWRPVYRYLRIVRAKTNDDAKDLTQAFYLWILEGETLASYDAAKGSFRGFLKILLARFAKDQDRMNGCLRRGGGNTFIPLDAEGALPADGVADPQAAEPWAAFDQEWAYTICHVAIGRIRRRREAENRALPVAVFEAYDLVPEAQRPTYGELARRFGVKESDVGNFITSIRHELYAEIRAELSGVTRGDEDLRREWNDLF